MIATQYQRMVTERCTWCPESLGQEQRAPSVSVRGNRQRPSCVLQNEQEFANVDTVCPKQMERIKAEKLE